MGKIGVRREDVHDTNDVHMRRCTHRLYGGVGINFCLRFHFSYSDQTRLLNQP